MEEDHSAVVEPPVVDELSELRYEVMYLLHAPDQAIEEFKKIWAGSRHSSLWSAGTGMELSYTHQ